ncbi:MAG: GUN4 domain-containing protein [Cyanobacteria bacterium SID2]|nr:GUN4 domain-containing protein [Cyanobacteria bacterium SID2]
MHWKPGRRIASGKYTIEDKLGEGGFCITYRARTETGDFVAVKTSNEDRCKPRDFAKWQQNLANEALLLAKCRHPQIVGIREMVLEGLRWCSVLEYIDGIDLASWIEQDGALAESDAIHYISQIADALEVVHREGFLHRDIKPLNILMRKGTSEAVLIDFGMARSFTPGLTDVHSEYVSHGFSPIEQYDRQSLRGVYTDVYGLAATLYALVTGEIPRSAVTRYRSVAKQEGDPLVAPKVFVPTLSDRINTAILQGMAIEPDDRPQSITAWRGLLGDRSSEESIASPPVSEPPLSSDSEPRKAPGKSAVGLDYSTLESYLKQEQWQEADRETDRLFLAACGRDKGEQLGVEDIDRLSERDLRSIEDLWYRYSQGRFGFAIQQRLWREVDRDYTQFGDRLGWSQNGSWLPYTQLQFHTNAPEGHLPTWGRRGRLWPLLSKQLRHAGIPGDTW